MINRLILTTSVVTLFNLNLYALTGGAISNELLSTEQLGMSASVAGGQTDPIVTYTNPASIGDIGKFNVTGGGSYLFYSGEHTAPGVSEELDDVSIFVPNFGATYSFLEGKVGVGLAVISPFGLETTWSKTSSVRYVATNSELKMFNLTPAVSYRHNEKFAVGFGLDYMSVFEGTLERQIAPDVVNAALIAAGVPGTPTAGSADGSSKLEGDGDQWGYHAGLLFSPHKQHHFGLAYHNEVKVELDGDLNISGLTGVGASTFGSSFKTPSKADIFLPQNIQIGYAYEPNDTWRFEADGHWFDWSSNKEILGRLPGASALTKAVFESPVPLDWKDIWSFGLGTSYTHNEIFKLNGSFYYISTPVPEQTFNPAIPDSDRWGIAVGPSFTRNNFKLDLVYSPEFYQKRTVSNNIGLQTAGFAAADIDGTYDGDIQFFSLNASYRY